MANVSKRAPYGTWESPISAESVVTGANAISDILVDPVTSSILHIESRPSEGGRNVLVDSIKSEDAVPKDTNVRTSVHEYGGGEAKSFDGTITFSNFTDGRVYQVKLGAGDPQPVTPENPAHRFADFSINPVHPHLIVAVLEDHTVDEPSKIVNTLCIINTTSKTVSALKSGADFYAAPRFSPKGTHVVYQQWFHPDMSWEGSEIMVAEFEPSTAKILAESYVAGEKLNISATYPSWATEDVVIFTTDVSGYQTPWMYSLSLKRASALFKEPIDEEFGSCGLAWKLGWSNYAVLSNGKYAIFSAVKDGREVFYGIDLSSVPAQPVLLDTSFAIIESLRAINHQNTDVIFLGLKSDSKKSIYKGSVDISSSPPKFTYQELIPSSTGKFSSSLISNPRPIVLTPKGPDYPIHVNYYAPTNPDYSGSSIEGEKPPCIVNAHGGPTALADQGLQWSKMYYTSRGFAWLDVNYGGSSGYGRDYIRRLEGSWGIVDVQDCILAVQALSDPQGPYKLIDPKRLTIRGSSSGGYTVLAGISCPSAPNLNVFAAAVSCYGISDLGGLMGHTHKFESNYGHKLIGGLPAARGEVDPAPICAERSPIKYADKITTPLLLLQGDRDRVVPKPQSDAIYENLKARDAFVEYKVYEGEGHGWRKEENMRDAMETELNFYKKVMKL